MTFILRDNDCIITPKEFVSSTTEGVIIDHGIQCQPEDWRLFVWAYAALAFLSILTSGCFLTYKRCSSN